MYICKHCNEQIALFDHISSHDCFLGKAVFMEEDNNVLFYCQEDEQMSCPQSIENDEEDATQLSNSTSKESTSKEHAIWDKKATLAAISLYEANIELMDHPKKKGKIWEAIRIGLLEFGIKMTNDQVRWKINALVKKYKEVVDNNSLSGRAPMDFEWYEQMDEILGSRQRAIAGQTVSSKLTSKTSNPCTSTSLKKSSCGSSPIATSSSIVTLPKSTLSKSTDSTVDSNVTDVRKRKRLCHGTGSKTAATKVELEKQWLHHLQKKEERDHTKDQKYATLIETKKDALKLKKRQLDLKEAELEQRKEIAMKKTKEKKNRHSELVEIERLKYKLLKKLVEDKENQNLHETSDSD
ncbi:uncharacterized protein [Temnothorax nylanderi]|uniref:uncharacterized protein n=1 Tax=Temnothorax nylanderi TaxID=102681 RepID=UPI003A886302